MNGFTNAILSLLLGWLRSLFNAVWRLLNSEGGGSLIRFLSDHWKLLVVVLCVGGFIVDRMVYLFRWRPYYVWSTKLGRLIPHRAKPNRAPAEDEPVPYQGQAFASSVGPPAGYAPPYAPETPAPTAVYAPPAAAPAPTAVYAPPPHWNEEPAAPEDGFMPMNSPTFAPLGGAPSPFEEDGGDYDSAPLFDEEPWPAEDDTRVATPLFAPPGAVAPSRPEPASYFTDVQNGFAPPPTPEELYRKRSEPIVGEPVHPGLDLETFRENVGLGEGVPQRPAVRTRRAPPAGFTPFPDAAEPEPQPQPRGGLSALARRARTLVGGMNDEDQPSIRDLHNTVDVKTAFHAPVYPKQARDESEEE